MEFKCEKLSELDAISVKILKELKDKKVIAFSGDMGAGKTTLIQSLCRTIGTLETATSPTYSLVNEYKTATGETIYHFDFYRIKNEEEAFDMGYEEYLYSGNKCFIEWPEKISNLLPEHTVQIKLKIQDPYRIITLQL